MSEEIEVILTWSRQSDDGSTPYMGNAGESVMTLTRTDLWALLTKGQRDDEGNVVTSVTIWPTVPPRSQGNTTVESGPGGQA